MRIAERYRIFLGNPGVMPVLLVGAVARLPVSMYALAILLLLTDRGGSFAEAGLITACAAAGYAITGPMLGRAADRLGQTRPLILTAAVNATAFGCLIAAVFAHAPLAVLAGCAVLVGATIPPVAACQRASWRQLLAGTEDLLDTAMAVDSFLLDVFLILGPLVVTGIAALASPLVAALACAVLLAGGGVAFAALPVSRRHHGRRAAIAGSALGPVRAPAFRLLLCTVAAAGLALGSLRIGLVGFASSGGSADLGGLLYTGVGVGSAVGGLWYGNRRWQSPLELRYPVLLAAYAAVVMPLLAGQSVVLMFVLAVVAGTALSPMTICEFLLVGRCAPDGTVAEAFAWATTATFVGNAVGNVVAGFAVDHLNWRAAVGLSALTLTLAAVAAAARRTTFRLALDGVS